MLSTVEDFDGDGGVVGAVDGCLLAGFLEMARLTTRGLERDRRAGSALNDYRQKTEVQRCR